MGFNEDLYEMYGLAAADKGLFKEWQVKTSSILEENPNMDRWDAGKEAYFHIVGSDIPDTFQL